jgi:RimJ/RimL family protein N-acetyltransferase
LSGALLGLVGPDYVDAAQASAELSFLLHERFWGQGCATDPYFSFQLSAFQLLPP